MQFVSVPDVGVPRSGVTSVGDVANTAAPVPVSSVNAPRKFALDGVARNVATPVPSPLTPVLIGRPVQFVNVPDVGVPSRGVTNVGDVSKTKLPVPVEPVTSPIATAPNVGAPAALPCRTVVVVPSEAIGVGVAPAPAPRIRAWFVSATDEASVVEPVKPRMPPEVPDVSPVPPLATPNDPATAEAGIGFPVGKIIDRQTVIVSFESEPESHVTLTVVFVENELELTEP